MGFAFVIDSWLGRGMLIPKINLTSQVKKTITRIGIRQEVTSITARASIMLLSTRLNLSTVFAVALLIPSVTLEKSPEIP